MSSSVNALLAVLILVLVGWVMLTALDSPAPPTSTIPSPVYNTLETTP